MNPAEAARRRFVQVFAAGAAVLAPARLRARPAPAGFVVATFGDSILDCGYYNERGVHPGQLVVRNDDALFPDFAGHDLQSFGPARIEHRARDGSRVDDLRRQLAGLRLDGISLAMITVGGNDLLSGLAADRGDGVVRFAQRLDAFLHELRGRPVLVGTVYDPTFGDDNRNFLGIDARLARTNLNRVNAAIADVAARHGTLVDVHGHFMRGDPSWFTRVIEPSLRGASEVRAAFLPQVLRVAQRR